MWCSPRIRIKICTPPQLAAENGWLEDDPFLLGNPVVRRKILVLGEGKKR